MAYEISSATDHYNLLAKIRTAVEATLPLANRWSVQRYIGATLGTVSSITKSGTTATVTMSQPHLMTTGDRVTISGASDSLYNIVEAPITTTVDPSIFTYIMTGTPAANATGTLICTRLNYEVIWKAPGLSGTEEIFCGIKAYHSTADDYYNFKIGCFTGYVPLNSFETQAGHSNIMGVPLWNQTTAYWLQTDGQHLFCVAKIENIYESFGFGKYLPYATPSQYPYPVFCMGGLTSATATRYSDTSHVSGFKGARSNFQIRTAAGAWINPDVYPYMGTRQLRNTITASTTDDGYYGLHAIVLSDSAPNVYGELDNLSYISGFNNAVENTVVDADSKTHVVLRDVWRTGFNDYIAMKLV
jgi:hypothetical protein